MSGKPQEKRVGFYKEILLETATLSNGQFGELMRASIADQIARNENPAGGVPYQGDDQTVAAMFAVLRVKDDRYREYCAKQQKNGGGGGDKEPHPPTSPQMEPNAPKSPSYSNSYSTSKKDKEVNTAAKPPHTNKTRFAKPTKEDITGYCQENGYAVDADKFIDFYDSKGWMIGKNPMKDWKAAVRLWARKEAERNDSRISSRAPAANEKYAGIGEIL